MNLPAFPNIKMQSSEKVGHFLKLAVVVGVMGASILVLIFLVWPKVMEALALSQANKELAARAAELDVKSQKLAGYNKSQLESQLGFSEALLPSDKGVFSLVAQIERATGTSGVVLERIDVVPGSVDDSGKSLIPISAPAAARSGASQMASDVAAENTPKVEVKVAISSDYKSFQQFLNTVMAFSRVVVVRDLALSASGGAGATQLKVSMTIEAYYQSLPTELSSIESPIVDISQSELTRLNSVKESGISGPPTLPSVQGGRSDLFAPF